MTQIQQLSLQLQQQSMQIQQQHQNIFAPMSAPVYSSQVQGYMHQSLASGNWSQDGGMEEHVMLGMEDNTVKSAPSDTKSRKVDKSLSEMQDESSENSGDATEDSDDEGSERGDENMQEGETSKHTVKEPSKKQWRKLNSEQQEELMIKEMLTLSSTTSRSCVNIGIAIFDI